ncbi:LPXTG cell wall anchor domain-containing protein [Bogoriella caseilytica]|uniref:LPXTG-motif cell wall-anchored protein n=1 Tax=Bogoriella caseilytica TaxID=56055 RepID=A0A3N2BF09_9MICO|nr:LPXTG cell wall anchor domain-containing protein [Bogoriella caseilytica]ROR73856.1 LPXTG-motif cell wall-anchored protein [Bogoriella caseilytica]
MRTTVVGRHRSARAAWAGRAAAAAAGVSLLALPVFLGPAASAQSEQDSGGLEVSYPDGTLELTDLTPGVPQTGHAQLTNWHPDALAIEVSSDWYGTEAAAEAVRVDARVCTSPWMGDDCPGTVRSIPMREERAELGVIPSETSWYVRVEAALPAEADNTAQDLSGELRIEVVAAAHTPPPSGAGPDDRDLPQTGTAAAQLTAVALLLTVAGAGVVRWRRARGTRGRLGLPARG